MKSKNKRISIKGPIFLLVVLIVITVLSGYRLKKIQQVLTKTEMELTDIETVWNTGEETTGTAIAEGPPIQSGSPYDYSTLLIEYSVNGTPYVYHTIVLRKDFYKLKKNRRGVWKNRYPASI